MLGSNRRIFIKRVLAFFCGIKLFYTGSKKSQVKIGMDDYCCSEIVEINSQDAFLYDATFFVFGEFDLLGDGDAGAKISVNNFLKSAPGEKIESIDLVFDKNQVGGLFVCDQSGEIIIKSSVCENKFLFKQNRWDSTLMPCHNDLLMDSIRLIIFGVKRIVFFLDVKSSVFSFVEFVEIVNSINREVEIFTCSIEISENGYGQMPNLQAWLEKVKDVSDEYRLVRTGQKVTLHQGR